MLRNALQYSSTQGGGSQETLKSGNTAGGLQYCYGNHKTPKQFQYKNRKYLQTIFESPL